jgi:hypothetical protein
VRIAGVLLMTAGWVLGAANAASGPARFVRFSEARPTLAELAGRLPPGLDTLPPAQMETAWPRWIERRDREIRARLEQGDEDTIVNWTLFGTTFTSKPRAVLGAVESGTADDRELVLRRTIELISARVDDLLDALAAPGSDERRLFARAFLQRRGLRFATAADRDAARMYLRAAIIRVAGEQDQIDQELGATSSGNPMTEFVARSRLFRTRGLSLDTSLIPDYSVQQALAAMKTRGLLAPGAVRRVAIVGPGLDFADKDVGLDFYPPQTVQPFAVLDSLARLGLSPAPGGAEMVLLDISPRIIAHVTQARARAARNIGYTVNLPLARSTAWLPEIRTYWQTFGDRIGAPIQTRPSQAFADLAELRSIRARPVAVQRMSVSNVNIVTQRLDGEAFDLVIATNVFIYYDVLEQALAMSNVEAMLKPGAFLLANFSAPDLKSITIRPLGTTTTNYARGRAGSDSLFDVMVWYKAHAIEQ